MRNVINYLRNVPLFSQFGDSDLALVAAPFTHHSYNQGQKVISRSEPGDSLYIVVEGKLRVALTDEDGKEIVLDRLGPGEFFGEMSLLDGKPRSADVFCDVPCRVLRLGRREFQDIIRSYPSLMSNLLTVLCERLRHANDIIQGINISKMYIY